MRKRKSELLLLEYKQFFNKKIVKSIKVSLLDIFNRISIIILHF